MHVGRGGTRGRQKHRLHTSTEILDSKVLCFWVRKSRQLPVRSGQHRNVHSNAQGG